MEAASFTCDLSEAEKPYIELRGWKRIICVFFLSIENTNILKVVVYSASREVVGGLVTRAGGDGVRAGQGLRRLLLWDGTCDNSYRVKCTCLGS